MKVRSKIIIPIILTVSILTIALGYFIFGQSEVIVKSIINFELDDNITTVIDTMQERQEVMDIVKSSMNDKYINLTKMIAALVASDKSMLSSDNLKRLSKELGVDEIHIIDEDGIIRFGNVPEFFGFDFKTSDQTKPFLKAIEDKNFTLAQEPTPRGIDKKLF